MLELFKRIALHAEWFPGLHVPLACAGCSESTLWVSVSSRLLQQQYYLVRRQLRSILRRLVLSPLTRTLLARPIVTLARQSIGLAEVCDFATPGNAIDADVDPLLKQIVMPTLVSFLSHLEETEEKYSSVQDSENLLYVIFLNPLGYRVRWILSLPEPGNRFASRH